jgi:hypothetical protein
MNLKNTILLTRDAFRENVFKRDQYKCVNCGNKGQDAHHLLERRLWDDGGYYLNNGVTLCGDCHIKAEQTLLSVEELREKAGITTIILPEHLYIDQIYDKWGNAILPNGKRLIGELFEDESVQKILKTGGVLNDFTKYIKYPRTYHMPGSLGTKDDKMLEDDSQFYNKKVVVTLKMDGENTTWYNDYSHARSIDSGSHESRNWVKGLWAQKAWQLSEGMRICGENLYAQHTIHYDSLPSYFMVFSIWDKLKCLSWEETEEYIQLLELECVPVIFKGNYNRKEIDAEFEKYKDSNEGYVIRIEDEFNYGDFRKSVAKYVQPQFRQQINNSHGHWISKKIIQNKIK